MIDVNLLKKSGIYSANKNDFSDIDDLEKKIEDREGNSTEVESFDNDAKNNDNKKNKKSKKTSLKILTLLLMLFIAGGYYFYYHHFQDNHEIEASHIEELILYSLNNEDISIESIRFDSSNIEFNFKISPTSFKKYKSEIGEYVNKMNSSNCLNFILSKNLFTIKSLDNIVVVNDKFDEFKPIQSFKSYDILDIDKNNLKMVIDSIFSINNAGLIDFNIVPSRDLSYSRYNILLSK